MTKPHHATAHKIINQIVAGLTPPPWISSPDAWRRSRRNDIRHAHWQTLMDILDPDSERQIPTLAGLLAPENAEPANPSSRLQHWTGPHHDPDDGEPLDQTAARERLDAIRSQHQAVVR